MVILVRLMRLLWVFGDGASWGEALLIVWGREAGYCVVGWEVLVYWDSYGPGC